MRRGLISAAILVTACIFAWMADTGRFFGPAASKVFPCAQDPATSFPCSWPYDVAVLLLSLLIALAVALRLVFSVFRRAVSCKKQSAASLKQNSEKIVSEK